MYPVYTAWVIQIHTRRDATRLQNRPWPLDKVYTARLLHGQSHHHLHHLRKKETFKTEVKHKHIVYF